MLRFSIIIPHRNGEGPLQDALTALSATIDPQQDEVILVDNGSTDDSVTMARDILPGLVVIANPCNKGFGRACNQGLRRAQGRYALILNDDARVPPDTLNEFARRFDEIPDAAIFAPQLVGPDGTLQRSFGFFPDFRSETGIGRKRRLAPATGDSPRRVDTVVGACMAVRRAAIDQCGTFDEDFFFYFEETEWCHRLQANGWGVWLLPRLRVVHGKGVSTRPLRRAAQLEMFRSRLLYYRKVFSPGQAALLTYWRIVRLALNMLASGIWTLFTLGLSGTARMRLATYATQLAWLVFGKPESWGLPDKCPRVP